MTVSCYQIHTGLRRLCGGERRRLTRFTNMGHPACVMNLPPTTINVLSSKAILGYMEFAPELGFPALYGN
jgi:hypothetical protein